MVVLMLGTITGTIVMNQSVNSIPVYAKSSPYKSGYNHGCDDAGISDPSNRYINQPQKGPTFQKEKFMSGYYDGFSSCGGNGASGSFIGNDNAQTPDFSDVKGVFNNVCTRIKGGDFAAAQDLVGLIPLAGQIYSGAKLACDGADLLGVK
jgi:hypothetical protein